MWRLIIVLVVLALLVIWLIAAYNGLIRRRNQIENAWSQIDVQLKRRHDLIPNLVETVKGYAAHERSVLERVTAARVAAKAHVRDSPPELLTREVRALRVYEGTSEIQRVVIARAERERMG